MSGNEQRLPCPNCGLLGTYYTYICAKCGRPWIESAKVGTDGKPATRPCPGCQSDTQYPPVSMKCALCGYTETYKSPLGKASDK